MTNNLDVGANIDLDNVPKKIYKKGPQKFIGKKGKRLMDMEDAGEISAEETDEDNIKGIEETKENNEDQEMEESEKTSNMQNVQ